MSDVVQGKYPIPAEYGERVKWTSVENSVQKFCEGEGIFTLAWLGIEEVWDILLDDGRTIHLYPCFGDSMEVIHG